MVPDGAAAVAAFLGFIAPGVLFEMVAGRRRAPVKHTALFEVGRAVLVSAACTGLVGLVVLLCWRVWGPDMPLMRLWVLDPDRAVIGALIGVGVSCALAGLAGWWVTRGRGAPVKGVSVMQVAMDRSPEDSEAELRVVMADGTTWQGRCGSRTVGVGDEHPYLELLDPHRRLPGEEKMVELSNWTSVVLPEHQATHVLVAHTLKS